MSIQNDIQILRSLARKYLEIANHPHNEERKILHRAGNDIKMIRPVVLINELPWNEMNINDELTVLCENNELRGYEWQMRKALYQFKHFRADMIVRPYIAVPKAIHSTGIGVSVEEDTIKINKEDTISAHEYHDQFEDCQGLDKLHKAIITYDEEDTLRRYNFIANIIGDILPVKITGRDHVTVSTWDQIASFRGVTPLLIDLIDEPEFTHELVEKLTEIQMDIDDQYLKLGLFDTDPSYLHATPILNSTLHPDVDNCDFKNIWGRGVAQIFASVSKQDHEEFDIEYMKKAVGRCGLVYYGCCEPLDKKIDIVEKIPNLRKISITPWADINVAAEAIGQKYVIASKPNPSSVSVGKLDHDALKKEIKTILDACKRNNCSFDIVLKDISTTASRPENIFEWEQIVMDMVNNY